MDTHSISLLISPDNHVIPLSALPNIPTAALYAVGILSCWILYYLTASIRHHWRRPHR